MRYGLFDSLAFGKLAFPEKDAAWRGMFFHSNETNEPQTVSDSNDGSKSQARVDPPCFHLDLEKEKCGRLAFKTTFVESAG